MVYRVVQADEEVILFVSVDCVGNITAIDKPPYVATDTRPPDGIGCSFATFQDALVRFMKSSQSVVAHLWRHRNFEFICDNTIIQ